MWRRPDCKAERGKLGESKSVLCIDWGGVYMVYTFVKTHQTEFLKYFHLLYGNYTFRKLIKNHKMRPKFSVLESAGFDNRRPGRSLVTDSKVNYIFSLFVPPPTPI